MGLEKTIHVMYPITLFAYKRPFHTYSTLKALSTNPEASQSILYAFIDGPRSDHEKLLVDKTKNVILNFTNQFKKLEIIESSRNKGLASSILNGVTTVFSFYPQQKHVRKIFVARVSYNRSTPHTKR